jgi:hypothetical protein
MRREFQLSELVQAIGPDTFYLGTVRHCRKVSGSVRNQGDGKNSKRPILDRAFLASGVICNLSLRFESGGESLLLLQVLLRRQQRAHPFAFRRTKENY